jgi:hypothetical protein
MGLSLGHATAWLHHEAHSETAGRQYPATPEPRSPAREIMMSVAVHQFVHSDPLNRVGLTCAAFCLPWWLTLRPARIKTQSGEDSESVELMLPGLQPRERHIRNLSFQSPDQGPREDPSAESGCQLQTTFRCDENVTFRPKYWHANILDTGQKCSLICMT